MVRRVIFGRSVPDVPGDHAGSGDEVLAALVARCAVSWLIPRPR